MSNTWSSLSSPLRAEDIASKESSPKTSDYIFQLRCLIMEIATFRGMDKNVFNSTIQKIKDEIANLQVAESDSIDEAQFKAIINRVRDTYLTDIQNHSGIVVELDFYQREALDRFNQALAIES